MPAAAASTEKGFECGASEIRNRNVSEDMEWRPKAYNGSGGRIRSVGVVPDRHDDVGRRCLEELLWEDDVFSHG